MNFRLNSRMILCLVLFTLTATTAMMQESSSTDADPTLYDNFDDPAYEGRINETLWLATDIDQCQFTQQGGELVYTRNAKDDEGNCNLTVNHTPIRLEELGAFEAHIKIGKDHSGGANGIAFGTQDLPGENWLASCQIDIAEANIVNLHFEVKNWGTDPDTAIPDISIGEPGLEHDRWYTLRLEVDPETVTFFCYVDNVLVGSVVPKDAEALQEAAFNRWVNFYHNPGASGTTYLDDVRIISPSEMQTVSFCTVSANANVNLRSGPGTDFQLQGTLSAGQVEAVDGQTLGSDGQVWWHLAAGAWVRSDVVEETEDCEAVTQISPDSALPILYDDFNDPTYEGAMNTALWDVWEGCEIRQENGAVVFTSALKDEPVFCAISLPGTIPVEKVGGLEAKLKIAGDGVSDGGAVQQEIGIQSVNLSDGTYWHVQCQLEDHSNVVGAYLQAMHWNGDDLVEQRRFEFPTPLAFDTWYTLRAEVDAATMTFSCYLDGQLIGTVVPSRADELRTVKFMRHIKTDRSPNTTATTFADDVRITPAR